NGAGSTAGFLQNMARTLPPMMQVMKDIGGVELPEFMGRLADGDGRKEAAKVPMPVPIVGLEEDAAASGELVPVRRKVTPEE
ncbi:MAG: hypothetical protein ACR2H9_04930, partial [Longimicrobiaceae bacterium]